jgi:hypothetical protein
VVVVVSGSVVVVVVSGNVVVDVDVVLLVPGMVVVEVVLVEVVLVDVVLVVLVEVVLVDDDDPVLQPGTWTDLTAGVPAGMPVADAVTDMDRSASASAPLGCTGQVTSAVAPAARSGMVWVASPDASVSPSGRATVADTPVAVAVPLFCTVATRSNGSGL